MNKSSLPTVSLQLINQRLDIPYIVFHQNVYKRVGYGSTALSANNVNRVTPAYNELANTIKRHQGGVGKHYNEINIPFLEKVSNCNTCQ